MNCTHRKKVAVLNERHNCPAFAFILLWGVIFILSHLFVAGDDVVDTFCSCLGTFTRTRIANAVLDMLLQSLFA